MKRISFSLLIAGALVGLALLITFKPDSQKDANNSMVVPEKRFESSPRHSAREVMELFSTSETASERLGVAAEFRNFSSDEFEEALELSGYLDERGRLSHSAKCLLVAWAEKDGRAALEWSWSHLKESGEWVDAFAEVARTWVGSDPSAAIEFFHEVRKSKDEITKGKAKGSDAIILDPQTLEVFRSAFFANDSSTALLAIQEGVGFPRGVFPRRLNFSDLLNSIAEVEVAQENWKDIKGAEQLKASLASRLTELTPREPEIEAQDRTKFVPKYQGLTLSANSRKRGPVLQRTDRQRLAWNAVRIDFKRAVEEAQSLSGGEREAVFLAMYDSWHMAHPGEVLDFTLLPNDAQQLWQDLDGMGPIEDSFSSSQWHSQEFEKE
jgi:hypothetical protein